MHEGKDTRTFVSANGRIEFSVSCEGSQINALVWCGQGQKSEKRGANKHVL